MEPAIIFHDPKMGSKFMGGGGIPHTQIVYKHKRIGIPPKFISQIPKMTPYLKPDLHFSRRIMFGFYVKFRYIIFRLFGQCDLDLHIIKKVGSNKGYSGISCKESTPIPHTPSVSMASWLTRSLGIRICPLSKPTTVTFLNCRIYSATCLGCSYC